MQRSDLRHAKRWVVKLGSSLLTDNGRGLASESVKAWAAQLAALRASGKELVVVSSGAVAAGILRLNLAQRPSGLSELQAAAAVGQLDVVQMWERALALHDMRAAQVLLTHEEAANRQRYLNARNTLRVLLAWGVVPIVNENDTVANDEIRFGDNDTLAALAADLSSADVLVILTDQQGLYDADPRKSADAKLIHAASVDEPWLEQVAGGSGTALGRGGMQTKLTAARMAARFGVPTLIAGGAQPDVLTDLAAGKEIGSLLYPGSVNTPLSARKRWIAAQRRVVGRVYVDDGAVRALTQSGRSLLPVGVKGVEGAFQAGDLIACVGPDGDEVARGLSNYDAVDATRLCGVDSSQINARLGRMGEVELIHRDNLVLC